MNLRSASFISLFLLLSLHGLAQIVVLGLPHDRPAGTPSNARTKALSLPFFDDFSATPTTFADPKRWTYGRSVRINDGMAIRPPSTRVATFDGIDSTGRPYSAIILAKGYADKLESEPIDLTTVAAGERNSVILSFMYQLKGNGERPDAGDRLLVSFLDKDQRFVAVDTIEADESMQTDVFYTSVVPVNEERFFHAGFKFRIQNFARLSGPYDSWNVDYIYLNKGRTLTDLSFPDRTIVQPMSSMFRQYRSVPIKHFQKNPAAILAYPSVVASNMRDNNPQPVDFSTSAAIGYRQNGTFSQLPRVPLDVVAKENQPLVKGSYVTITSRTLPDLTALAFNADSIVVDMTFAVSTRDNKIVDPEGDGRGDTDPDEGDYDPLIYAPIDFRYSDTTKARYTLDRRYAYDDGEAEYGAGLNQPGAQLAYRYDMLEATSETITHFEMYFPRFGDESPQVMELRIWNDLNEEPVYREVTSIKRSDGNVFWWHKLTDPVPVGKTFYIGWKQNGAAVIAAGLDKNTSSGDKLFSNVNGSWVQNTSVVGSLMFRPLFGTGSTTPVGLEETKTLNIYPNPGTGTFYFDGEADRVEVYDVTGRPIPVEQDKSGSETRLVLGTTSTGIYIVRVNHNGTIRTAKVMIR